VNEGCEPVELNEGCEPIEGSERMHIYVVDSSFT